MHLPPLIQDLAVILAAAGLMSLIFQKIKQPVVLGYILAGMFVGPHTPPFQMVTDLPGIQIWAELGVIFLMFSLGLEFSFRKLARVGAPAALAAGTEVLFFVPVGYWIGRAFGWSFMDSIFLGAMLSISSTTIIIKAFDELRLKTRRFAELVFAVLIVEDLFAILLLVGLTTIATTESVSTVTLFSAAAKLILVVGGWFIVGYFLVPRFVHYVGRVGNNEMLTLASLGLCLGLVVFATQFQYSTALGAFIMGSILAESPLLRQIEGRMEPLRDLFGAIFFVSIGMLIDPKILWEYKGTIAILCAVTIVGKVISTGMGALLSGQSFKNSVRVGFSLAQIGEFSFIIAALGMSLKVTSDFLYPIAVAVSLVTTFTTPYLIRWSGTWAEWLDRRLPVGVKTLLGRYADWNEERRRAMDKKKDFFLLTLRWMINGLTVSVIFVLSREFLMPILEATARVPNSVLKALAWLLAVLLSAPFIWGMYSTFKRDKLLRVPQVLFRILTLLWVAILSLEFFPARFVALGIALAMALLIGFFYRSLEEAYQWFEKHFLSIFEASEKGESAANESRRLAPWDEHLVRIRIHPNATFAGKSLSEVQLRNRYGINVVAIQRGSELMVAPIPSDRLLPFDEILVLGTDEEVEAIKPFLELPGVTTLRQSALTGYELRRVEFKKGSLFSPGTTIRNSGLRERYGAMVVGVESKGKRIMNPDSDMVISGDLALWLVGPSEALTRLEKDVLA